MISRLLIAVLFFSGLAQAANTLTLISGNGQLVQTGSGLGSQPIVFQLTNGTAPVPNVVITFVNSNGSFDTGLSSSILTTNASGIISAQFVPTAVNGDYQTFALEASAPGSNIVTFYETAAELPETSLTLIESPVNPPQYLPYTVSAGQPGPPIEINVFGGGGVANVSLSLEPVVSPTTPPTGTLIQNISCLVNGQLVPQVLTNSTGYATCVPVFQYSNVALLAQYNGGYTFRVVIGQGNSFGPYSYQINPLPVSISGGPEKQVVPVGAPINIPVTAANGIPPYSFTLEASGGAPPPGVTLSPTGVLVGTPTAPGVYPFIVQVTDSKGNVATSTALNLSLAVSAGAITIKPLSLAAGFVGQPYSQTISIAGGVPGYRPGITGALPPGLTGVATDTAADTFVISGTPTTAGAYPFSFAVLDAASDAQQAAFTIGVATKLTFAPPTSIPLGTLNTPYSLALAPTGGIPPYSFTATGLPAGLTLSTAGVISGTPTGPPMLYPVTITIGDSGGESFTVSITIAISGGPLVYPETTILPAANVGEPYTATITPPTGGVPPYSFALTGTVPVGVALSTAGMLTGTFATAGIQDLSFTVTDAAGDVFSGTLQIQVGTVPTIATVVNSASFSQGTGTPAVTPGELVSIFGTNLGPTTGVGATVGSNGLIGSTLAGVQVFFGLAPAAILYVSAGQINAVVPFDVASVTSSQVTVVLNGVTSTAVAVNVQSASPGIYLLGGTQGAVLNSDSTVNSATNPATQGKYVQIYATGGGQFTPPLADGQIPTEASTSNIAGVTVTIGGAQAQVLYAGAGPGLVAGVLEINVLVPTGLAGGNAVPVVLSIGGQVSTQTVTIAVAP